MNLESLQNLLRKRPDAALEIRLPDGSPVPPHFHVTELGLVTKDFFDCGGTRRQNRAWTVQAWVADDVDHRLTPAKFGRILALHEKLGGGVDLPVRVEYQGATLETYAVASADVGPSRITLALQPVETDCLAKDQCGVLPPNLPALPETACRAPGCC